jgi:hypothetical protein
MLIVPDEIVTGALVNAIAVVGRQITKAASGLRKPDDDLSTARWFETFRLTGTVPDLPDLPAASSGRLVAVLSGAEIQAALQGLLAARLTDAPETDGSQARDAVRAVVSAADPDAATSAEALAGYYDDQICALVARLEAEEPPLLAQIRSEAFSSRMISILQAIEQHTAALADDERGRSDGRTAGHQVSGSSAGMRAAGSFAVRLLAEATNPFDLEVHRPVQADAPPPGLPALPAYVSREHDLRLAEVVRAAVEGTNGIAVLVGSASTGKTRACWEALRLLRGRPERWRLWHPIDPSRPEAALRELPSIGPWTVIWLNEAQLYLDVAADKLGERVAAGLRGLLRDPARAPVLVLVTLWPQFWDRLTGRPSADEDSHAQARELLTGWDISVPAAFSPAQLEQLAASRDPRLARAAEAAEDGQVIQFLAGAPELMARYRNAPSAAAALINAAIDARRLGMGVALSLPFLEAATPGYLTDTEWDALGEDWLEEALAFTAAPCKGVRGPLAPIRPRATRSAVPDPGPTYRLADYLDHQGRRARRQLPPADFWKAAARFADSSDLPALARASETRGLLRDAALLRKHATTRGDTSEAAALIRYWHSVHPYSADPDPARWAVAHAALDHPDAVVELFDTLLEAGAEEQAAALLARNPAAHAALDDPDAVAGLLSVLREAGAQEQAAALASRAAGHVPLDDPYAVGRLMDTLRETGAHEQAAALLARDPAVHASVISPDAVTTLLVALLEVGSEEQARTLASRAAAYATVEDPDADPYAVGVLLGSMLEAGAEEQAAALASRVAAEAPLGAPETVYRLLSILLNTGAKKQATALGDRAAAHAPLDDPQAITELLDTLREVGTKKQVRALTDRAAANVSVDDPGAVAGLLHTLRRAGAEEQAAALLARDPAAHAALDDPDAVAGLLSALREAGAQEQAAALLARDPAALVSVDDPRAVAGLLSALREAGAQEQAAALASRAAQAPLDRLGIVAGLLRNLLEAGAQEQAITLAKRAAVHAALDYPGLVALLLHTLLEAGAQEQARTLIDRLPAEGRFDLFLEQADHQTLYRFGREPDGSPAPSWGWDDLD